jgi:hypothetical protein
VKESEETKAREGKILAKVSELRSKLALAEAENIRLKKELSTRPIPQAGPSVDEKLTWRKEKAAMDLEIRSLRKEVETRSKREEEAVKEMFLLKVVRGENERLKYGWGVMTDRYVDLYETYQFENKERKREKQAMESDISRLDRTVCDLEVALAAKEEERQDHQYYIDCIRTERDSLSEIIDVLRAGRIEQNPRETSPIDEMVPLAPMIELSDISNILDLTSSHTELAREQGSDLEPHILTLTASILHLEQSLRETTSALTTSQTAYHRIETEYAETRLEHASCAVTISQLRYDADQANQITAVREEELGEVRAELLKADDESARQADLLARAEESEARSKFALESLEEEIVQ